MRYRAADLRAVLAQSTAGIWRVQGLVQVQEGVARVRAAGVQLCLPSPIDGTSSSANGGVVNLA